jgi:hypothetical protein
MKSYNTRRIMNLSFYKKMWVNHTPYYRSFLFTYSHYFVSPITYLSSQAKITNNRRGKSKYLSTIVGKYIYNIFNFINKCSHLFQFFYDIKKYKKNYYKKIYRYNKLVFFKKIKHIIIFFKNKIKFRIRKKNSKLWKSFYNVPFFFWTPQKKKRIKSFIWRILNPVKQRKKIKFKYKRNKKNRFFFMNYNRISSYIFYLLNRKFYKKKQWFILKKKKRKKNLVKKKTTTNMWTHYFLSFLIYKKKKELHFLENSLSFFEYSSRLYINIINYTNFFLLHFNILYNHIHFIYFFINYCYFLSFKYYFNLYKFKMVNNKMYLNTFYYWLSNLYKKKNNIHFIKTNIINNLTHNIIFSYHFFYVRLNHWFEQFYMDRDLYCHFIVNKLISHKIIKNNIVYHVICNKYCFLFFIKYKTIHSDITRYYNLFQYFFLKKKY